MYVTLKIILRSTSVYSFRMCVSNVWISLLTWCILVLKNFVLTQLVLAMAYFCTTRFTYLLTYPIVQDITWKADSHSACQTTACFIYGTRRFITVLTKARHWTLS
jgi:hypothetical protein